MATSKMQKKTIEKIRRVFGKYDVVENSRPDWLISSTGGRLELDVFIPALNIAIEIQGTQHSSFVSKFHRTHKDFELQQKRDAEKLFICQKVGIKLFYVYSESEIDNIAYEVFDYSRKENGYKKVNYTPYKSFSPETPKLDKIARKLTNFMNNPHNRTISSNKVQAIREKINILNEHGNSEHKFIASQAKKFLYSVHIKGK